MEELTDRQAMFLALLKATAEEGINKLTYKELAKRADLNDPISSKHFTKVLERKGYIEVVPRAAKYIIIK